METSLSTYPQSVAKITFIYWQWSLIISSIISKYLNSFTHLAQSFIKRVASIACYLFISLALSLASKTLFGHASCTKMLSKIGMTFPNLSRACLKMSTVMVSNSIISLPSSLGTGCSLCLLNKSSTKVSNFLMESTSSGMPSTSVSSPFNIILKRFKTLNLGGLLDLFLQGGHFLYEYLLLYNHFIIHINYSGMFSFHYACIKIW